MAGEGAADSAAGLVGLLAVDLSAALTGLVFVDGATDTAAAAAAEAAVRNSKFEDYK